MGMLVLWPAQLSASPSRPLTTLLTTPRTILLLFPPICSQSCVNHGLKYYLYSCICLCGLVAGPTRKALRGAYKVGAAADRPAHCSRVLPAPSSLSLLLMHQSMLGC